MEEHFSTVPVASTSTCAGILTQRVGNVSTLAESTLCRNFSASVCPNPFASMSDVQPKSSGFVRSA